jgi:hypothetical protein
VVIWLWRWIPHPEKPASSGGPEIDFGIETEECLVLGEAKWNSELGVGQGVAGDRSQLALRVDYCTQLAPRVLGSVRHWVVLGVGREANVLSDSPSTNRIRVRNLAWYDLFRHVPDEQRETIRAYLSWKEKYSQLPAGLRHMATPTGI